MGLGWTYTLNGKNVTRLLSTSELQVNEKITCSGVTRGACGSNYLKTQPSHVSRRSPEVITEPGSPARTLSDDLMRETRRFRTQRDPVTPQRHDQSEDRCLAETTPRSDCRPMGGVVALSCNPSLVDDVWWQILTVRRLKSFGPNTPHDKQHHRLRPRPDNTRSDCACCSTYSMVSHWCWSNYNDKGRYQGRHHEVLFGGTDS